MRRSVVLGSVICLALAMTCSTMSASAAEPIKIGALYGFTSYMAPVAEEVSRGLKVAFGKFMPSVAGRKIEVISEDTASKSDLAVQKAKKLVERDKISVLFGPVHGGHGMAVSAYTDKMKVPYISVGTSTGGLITDRKWVWITSGALEGCSFPVGTYAYKNLGYRTCTILGTDREVGHEFVDGFLLSFKELGGKVIQEQWFPPGTTQFAPYVAKLEKADFMATWIGDADGIAGFPTIREMGVKMPIVQVEHGGVMLSPKGAKQIGKSLVGITTATWYIHTIDNPTNKAFVKEYEKAYGEVPGAFAGAAYEGAQMLVTALKATGGDTSPDKLRKALMEPIDTVSGRVQFTKDRSGIHNIFIVQMQEDLTTPKILEALKTRADVVEKNGKRTLKYSVVK
jgi:branched-chain amino acid transport system substrate-binding protein